jgi:hypothetical protein
MKKFKVNFKEVVDGYNGYDHIENRTEIVEARNEDSAINKIECKYKNSIIRAAMVKLADTQR